ncbi:3-keto-5-aminohexanoate cleavage protein [Rhizorhabdus histidinilytica]
MPDIRLETFVLHVGATNIGRYDFEAGRFVYDRVSSHTHEQMSQFLAWCLESGLQPGFIVREPGHVRHLLMYREMGLLKEPIMVHLNMSDSVPYGPMPDAAGVQSLLTMFPPHVRYEWFPHNYTTFVHDPAHGDTHRELNLLAVAMGGHIRTGLGDKPEWDGEQLSNVEMVRRMAAVARAVGREIATPDEARAMLGYSRRRRGTPRERDRAGPRRDRRQDRAGRAGGALRLAGRAGTRRRGARAVHRRRRVRGRSQELRGREALARFYARSASDFGDVVPLVGNMIFEVAGDRATGVSTLTGHKRGSGVHVFSGVYEDDFARVDGRWLFDRRRFTTYFDLLASG